MGGHPPGNLSGLCCCPQGRRSRLQTRGAGAPSCESSRSSRNATAVRCPVTQVGASRRITQYPLVFSHVDILPEKFKPSQSA